MPTLKTTDFVIVAVIAAVALAPLALDVTRKLMAGAIRFKLPGSQKIVNSDWREHWVVRLMVLQSELEAKPDQQEALVLCRNLIWQLLGGGPKP